MRPLSEATAKIAGRSFEPKYIALGRIVNNWRDIAGTKLADKAQPVKIHYRKKHGEKKPHWRSLPVVLMPHFFTIRRILFWSV